MFRCENVEAAGFQGTAPTLWGRQVSCSSLDTTAKRFSLFSLALVARDWSHRRSCLDPTTSLQHYLQGCCALTLGGPGAVESRTSEGGICANHEGSVRAEA